MVSPARHRGFAEICVRTGNRVLLLAGTLPNSRRISSLALALLIGMLLIMQPGQHQTREYPRSRLEMRTGGSAHFAGHASSASTCQALRGTGFHLLDDATNVPDACGHLPVPALRIANDEYSICTRTPAAWACQTSRHRARSLSARAAIRATVGYLWDRGKRPRTPQKPSAGLKHRRCPPKWASPWATWMTFV